VARAEGRPQAYPVKSRRLRRGRRRHALLWLEHAGRWWLVQRPARGVWAALWSLPEYDSADALKALVAAWPGRGEWLPEIEHALTHFDWTLQPLHWRLPDRLSAARLAAVVAALPAGRWFTPADAGSAGLPAPVRRLLAPG
jgi:A/G-specific adenine glycosylase